MKRDNLDSQNEYPTAKVVIKNSYGQRHESYTAGKTLAMCTPSFKHEITNGTIRRNINKVEYLMMEEVNSEYSTEAIKSFYSLSKIILKLIGECTNIVYKEVSSRKKVKVKTESEMYLKCGVIRFATFPTVLWAALIEYLIKDNTLDNPEEYSVSVNTNTGDVIVRSNDELSDRNEWIDESNVYLSLDVICFVAVSNEKLMIASEGTPVFVTSDGFSDMELDSENIEVGYEGHDTIKIEYQYYQ